MVLNTDFYQDKNFQAFYTDANEVRILMQDLLGDVSHKDILEPCAGNGAFLKGLHGIPNLIDAVDIDLGHVEELKTVLSQNAQVHHFDFIDYFLSEQMSDIYPTLGKYDALICNPPFGLKFTVEYRKAIKKKFPEIYARESFGLFIHFSLKLLKDGARFVYIVPDTFFTSRNHRSLREYLSKETMLTDIIQFKSKRFETVNFGYGNLCIIAGNKTRQSTLTNVRWSDSRNTDASLKRELLTNSEYVPLKSFADTAEIGWIHPRLIRSVKLPKNATTLGEIAECRTGIYTGDNSRFCAYDAENPPARKNGHSIDWSRDLENLPLKTSEKQDGIKGDKHYVQFIRGGHRKPFEKTHHAIDWSVDAVTHYRVNKKARLQNHAFYFQQGLAVPMVTSGRLSASLMSDSVFDQGVVGIFPDDNKMLSFLLIYLNSECVTEYKRLINPGANNSANYIKRLPVPVVSARVKSEADDMVEHAKKYGWRSIGLKSKSFIEKLLN